MRRLMSVLLTPAESTRSRTSSTTSSLVALLLGLSAIIVPWQTLLLSVLRCIVVPVVIAQLLRRSVLGNGGDVALTTRLQRPGPISIMALLATLVLLFGFQGRQILAQPLVIALLAGPTSAMPSTMQMATQTVR